MRTFFPTKAIPVLLCLVATGAFAQSLFDLSNADATSGLKAALEKGSSAAVARLGVDGGFLHNEQVRIKLPAVLEKGRPLLAMMGKSGQLDDLEVAMNRAAEAAVPMAKPLLINAVKTLTVQDAKNILSGGDTAVTDFFRSKTSDQLGQRFLPIVKGVTDRSRLSAKFSSAMGQAKAFGVAEGPNTVEEYVTGHAVDALFLMIAEEEREIRRDPIGSGSKILRKVFGSMQ